MNLLKFLIVLIEDSYVSEMCVCFFCFHFSVCLTIWFKFWVIIFTMYTYLLLRLLLNTLAVIFLLNLIYSNNNSKTVGIIIFIGPGLTLKLASPGSFARINVYVSLVMLNFICFFFHHVFFHLFLNFICCCNKHNLNLKSFPGATSSKRWSASFLADIECA